MFQFLARLKKNHAMALGNHRFTRFRITALLTLSDSHLKGTEPAQLDDLIFSQGVLKLFKNKIDYFIYIPFIDIYFLENILNNICFG